MVISSHIYTYHVYLSFYLYLSIYLSIYIYLSIVLSIYVGDLGELEDGPVDVVGEPFGEGVVEHVARERLLRN